MFHGPQALPSQQVIVTHTHTHTHTVHIPFTSGIPDFGSDGVRCFTREDVRGSVDGFKGEDSVLRELLA